MSRQRHQICAALLLLLSLGAPRGAEGQGGSETLTVFATQPLDFGVMLPGESVVAGTGDPLRRAELEVTGSGRVMLIVTLPPALQSIAGAWLPLAFGAGDGRYLMSKSQNATTFDPRVPVEIKIPPGQGGLRLHLGGTALANAAQPPGDYSATLSVLIVSTAN